MGALPRPPVRRVVQRHLGQDGLTTCIPYQLADDALGKLLLLLDHAVDPLLQGADADKLPHLHPFALADPKGAVRCLALARRVPPAVEVYDLVGRGQIEAGAASLQGEDEDRRSAAGLEARHHLVAPTLRGPSMQK